MAPVNRRWREMGIEIWPNIQPHFSNFLLLYGEVQCYSSKICSARIIAGDKLLSKNILIADKSVYRVSKYLCVDLAICDIPKYFCVDLDHWLKSTNVELLLKPTPFSSIISVLSLSPQFATSRSLSLYSLPNSPAMFYLYWFHIKSAWCTTLIIIDWQ